jgi:hypothetical protein
VRKLRKARKTERQSQTKQPDSYRLVSPFDKKLVSPRSSAPDAPSLLAPAEAPSPVIRRANEKKSASSSEQSFVIFAMVQLDCTRPFAPQIESPGSSKDSNANDPFPVTTTDSDAAASCFFGKNECGSRVESASDSTNAEAESPRTNECQDPRPIPHP